ncbi:hypothetical protein D3C71_2161060 [compost metagenome]
MAVIAIADEPNFMSARRVHEFFVAFFQIASAPEQQRMEHRLEFLPAVGQLVFVAGRVGGIEGGFDKSLILQRL